MMATISKRIVFILSIVFLVACDQEKLICDILIENGIVYTGIDDSPLMVSIAIEGDQIIFIGDGNSKNFEAKKTINASGLIVSPGFIDPHTHAAVDLENNERSHNLPFLMQGVTTVVTGNDGNSPFPIAKYNEVYASQGIGTNVVPLVGHGTVRNKIMGKSDLKATAEDILAMQELMQQEMDAGAFGMSTGLFYAPGSYSDTEEVITLAKTVSKNNGIYDTHLRDESSYTVGLIPAIEEAINIGREAKLPIHISHIKCLGVDVWNQSSTIIELIDQAQKEGIDVTANQYPYNASSTSLKAATVPRWVESGGNDSLFIRYDTPALKAAILKETKRNITRRGGPEKLLISEADDTSLVGLNLLEISQQFDLIPEAAVYKALRTGFVKVISFNMIEDDIINFMKQDWIVTGSDGGSGHPRKYGSFPRKYQKYILEDKVMTLAEFIHKSASKTADILKINKRGRLQVGNFADIIIFDAKEFKEKANFEDAFQLAEGLKYSIINGNLAIDDGVFTKELYGRVLKK